MLAKSMQWTTFPSDATAGTPSISADATETGTGVDPRARSTRKMSDPYFRASFVAPTTATRSAEGAIARRRSKGSGRATRRRCHAPTFEALALERESAEDRTAEL